MLIAKRCLASPWATCTPAESVEPILLMTALGASMTLVGRYGSMNDQPVVAVVAIGLIMAGTLSPESETMALRDKATRPLKSLPFSVSKASRHSLLLLLPPPKFGRFDLV